MGKLSLLAKLSLIALAVSVIDVFLFWSIIRSKQPNSFNELQNINSSNLNETTPIDAAKKLPLNIQLIATTDKSIYSSYQTILLNIKITSSQDLSNLIISAKGITDRLNRNYFNQNQIVSLSKNIGKEINLSQTLPSCNSCSGLIPGSYSIEVIVDYQGETLASKNINLTIKQ